MSEADANWLLSSAVQSGSALVAIVGGFIGARYVGLHSERLGAQRRVDDADARLIPATQDLANSQADVTRFEVSELLDDWDVYRAIADKGGSLATFEDVLEEANIDVGSTDEEALRSHLELLKREFGQAVERLAPIVPSSEDQRSWDAFRRREHLSGHHDDMWAWVYHEISEVRKKNARDERRKKERARAKYGAYVPPFDVRDFAAMTPAAITGSRVIANATRTTAEYHRLLGIRDDAERMVAQLRAERDAAALHVRSTAQPEGFGLAIAVLAYIALVAIAVPIVVMVNAPMTLPLWARIAVAALFLSGVAMLLLYLRAYAVFLRDESGSQRLPRSPLALLRLNPLQGLSEPGSTTHQDRT